MPKLERRNHPYTSDWRVRCVVSLALVALCLCAALPARADVVTDWNYITTTTVTGSPPQQGRAAAITHAAIFDAVNAIDQRYTVYAVSPPVTLPASQEAAVAAAAYGVLVRLFPAAKSSLDAQYAASLAQIPDGDAKQNGIAVGEFVAAEMVALRSSDGSAQVPYAPLPTGLGIWRQTPLTSTPSLYWWGNVTPFVLESATQFHVPPPPELTSAEYAADVNEVKLYGRASGSLRTLDQTELARFWAESGVLQWNRIARGMAAERQTTLAENARLFALLNMAFSDSQVVVFETKYRFLFWRPIHAIRENDGATQYDDGNPNTTPDPTFTPLITMPNHPEYLSGHCISSSAAAEVLTQFFGPNVGFNATNPTMPGVVRSFSSFWDAAREVVDARVFGGIHFRRSCTISNEVGRKIGKFAVKNRLLPLSGN
ncbi:MAG TPA: vanadium-dependent haloperoxidase [Pyrinomonadaceae bacterium]